jgi:hypothetical protein
MRENAQNRVHLFPVLTTGRSRVFLYFPAKRGTDMPANRKPRASRATPHWRKSKRTLYFRGEVVKQFKVPADNQEPILDEFERRGWPEFIKNPLPSKPGMSSKKRLHFTIGRLNDKQQNKRIEFFGDGTGKSIGWRAV